MKESCSSFSLNEVTAGSDATRPGTLWSARGLRRHFEFLARISAIFRRKRMGTFIRLFRPAPQTSILDVGGLPRLWDGLALKAQMTVVNLQPLPSHEACFLTPNQKFVQGDGTHLAWADKSFDIVFSNSVIEHLGTWENQTAFARECQRVGKAYWIQTPAREFPVEPHFLALFLHWCPRSWQRRLLRWCSLWGWLARPRPEAVDAAVAEVRLLALPELKSLFPDSQILVERWLGLPKSYIAYRIPPVAAGFANHKS
jgi:methyltransferase family protein